MKLRSLLQNARNYLKELTIITAGVLIALFISNYKENNQARDYHSTSIETINTEVESNYSSLKGVIEQRTCFLDTITKYSEDNITIIDLIKKVDGVQCATLNNSGLEFYRRCKMSLIDFKMMSTLHEMQSLSELIEVKLERLSDFVYSNILIDSPESKTIAALYLRDVLSTEYQLLQIYERLIDENNKTENNKE